MNNNKKISVQTIAVIALLAALSYASFTFLQIKIPMPGGDATSIHLGNSICVLGALLFGGLYGGLGGAIGMTIGDLFDPIYIVYAPKTFVLKFFIGLITGFVAHKVLRIGKHADNKKKLTTRAAIAGASGLLFNCIFDPLVGYYYKLLILGKPAAELTLVYNISATTINAVTSTIVATVVYVAVLGAMKKSGLFRDILK
ncbi:MAG: ECF transporter S component [Clostridia bacterium]|nr:ECF transporter S component [Clostridia bacterium]